MAAVPFLGTATAALVLERAGSEVQKERWLPGLAAGELRGAVGTRELLPDGDGADVVIVLESEAGLVGTDGVEPLETIDPTRRYGRVADISSFEELPGDIAVGMASATALRERRAGRRRPARARHDRRLREGAQAVRHARRRVPGRVTQVRRDASRHRGCTLGHVLRRLGCGRRARAPRRRVSAREGGRLRRRPAGDGRRDPGARRDRFHLGGRLTLAVQARAAHGAAPRRRPHTPQRGSPPSPRRTCPAERGAPAAGQVGRDKR